MTDGRHIRHRPLRNASLPLALQGVIDLVANKAITWDGEELGATFQARFRIRISGFKSRQSVDTCLLEAGKPRES